jgi:hypothetical protein
MSREVKNVINEISNFIYLLEQNPARASFQISEVFVEMADLMCDHEFQRIVQEKIDGKYEKLTVGDFETVMQCVLIYLEALAEYENRYRGLSHPVDDIEEVDADAIENTEHREEEEKGRV